MRLLGFNFTRLSAEKTGEGGGQMSINRNINVVDITQPKTSIIKTKDDVLAVKFDYKIEYSPKYAVLSFSGNILLGVDSKEAKKVLKEWKNKKMPDDFQLKLFNLILMKSDVKALELEDELNVPYHIPLPSLNKSAKPQKK